MRPPHPSPPAGRRDWRPWLFNLVLLAGAACLVLLAGWWAGRPLVGRLLPTPTPANTTTGTPAPPTATPTVIPLPAAAATTSSPPTPTATRVIRPAEVDLAATLQAIVSGTAQADESARAIALLQEMLKNPRASRPGPVTSHTRQSRLVLAQYFAWYDRDGWDGCNISAGDRPLEPYSSDDPVAIARHIRQAVDIGLDGFTLHWFAPGDRTDRNFEALLALSQGQPFYSSLVFSRHIWHGSPAPTRENIVAALRYVLDRHSRQPNFLHLDQKPVLFFTDMYRTPGGQSSQAFWASVRQEVDPQRQSWWIAEGLDPSYLDVFDGLFVFKITHAAYPNDYLKSSRWAARVRQWEQQTGQPKLWLATISPGWDDFNSGCKADVRVPTQPHRRDRAGGALYPDIFDAALQSQPDWLLVSSFNEWVEGTYIEPGVFYGDMYMRLTREFIRIFKGGQP